jgi:uncharacterized membrane protein
MESKVRIAGHPVHPMLVPFPIALWVFSLLCDLVYAFGGGVAWDRAAFYTLAGGIVGALAAAVPGLIDYRAIISPATKRIATWHLSLNLTLVVLFSIDLWLRTWMAPRAALPLLLSVVGVALLGVSGWLGGELVYVRSVGVASKDASDATVTSRRPAA